MSRHSTVDQYVNLFSEANFQGNSVAVPVHELITVYSGEAWLYRSVKMNGNKLYLNIFSSVTEEQYAVQYRDEAFTGEDVADLSLLTEGIEGVVEVNAGVLFSDDIIVSMDVTNKMRDFETSVKASITAPFSVETQCTYNHTQQNTPAVLSILSADRLSLSTLLTPEARAVTFPPLDGVTYATLGIDVTVTYDRENKTLALSPDFTELPYTIEKLDDRHFLVHFEYIVSSYNHCYGYSESDYRGDIDVCTSNVMFDATDSDNSWIYKSVDIYNTYYAPFLWLHTAYPEGGEGVDFNHYISYVSHQSIDSLPLTVNVTPVSTVRAIFTVDVLPVFIHLTNGVNPDDWQGFVLESTFDTPLLEVQKREYSVFCTSRPDTQPGLLCPVSYYPATLQTCNLRYGYLSDDGATVTWRGECGIEVDMESSDALNVTLSSDAPEDWVITAITSDDDGWHVYLTGSATGVA